MEEALHAQSSAAAKMLHNKVKELDATMQEREQGLDRKNQEACELYAAKSKELDEKHAATLELAVKAEGTHLLAQKEGRELMDACALLEGKTRGHAEEVRLARDETLKAFVETKTWAQRAIDAVYLIRPSFLGGKRSDSQVIDLGDQRDANETTLSPFDGTKPNQKKHGQRKRKVTKEAEAKSTPRLSKRLKSTPAVNCNANMHARASKRPSPPETLKSAPPAVERLTRKKTSGRRGAPSRSTSITATASSPGPGQCVVVSLWSPETLDVSVKNHLKGKPSAAVAGPPHRTKNLQPVKNINAMPTATTKGQLVKTLT
jgi:hypothetical protein